jgi:hypothetical protein
VSRENVKHTSATPAWRGNFNAADDPSSISRVIERTFRDFPRARGNFFNYINSPSYYNYSYINLQYYFMFKYKSMKILHFISYSIFYNYNIRGLLIIFLYFPSLISNEKALNIFKNSIKFTLVINFVYFLLTNRASHSEKYWNPDAGLERKVAPASFRERTRLPKGTSRSFPFYDPLVLLASLSTRAAARL